MERRGAGHRAQGAGEEGMMELWNKYKKERDER